MSSVKTRFSKIKYKMRIFFFEEIKGIPKKIDIIRIKRMYIKMDKMKTKADDLKKQIFQTIDKYDRKKEQYNEIMLKNADGEAMDKHGRKELLKQFEQDMDRFDSLEVKAALVDTMDAIKKKKAKKQGVVNLRKEM